jgi:hypothetical protein
VLASFIEVEDARAGVLRVFGLPIPVGLGIDIGRDPACGFAVPDDILVSRKHARIESVRTGDALRVRVVDLGSTSGTFVDEMRVTDDTFADRSVLRLGQQRFRLRVGPCDDVVGAGFTAGHTLLFAGAFAHAHSFMSVELRNDDVVIAGAHVVARDTAGFMRGRRILSSDGVRAIVDGPEQDGPSLAEIIARTTEQGVPVDNAMLAALARALPAYANELHEVAVTFAGDVVVRGNPAVRSQMIAGAWFMMRIMELGLVQKPPGSAGATTPPLWRSASLRASGSVDDTAAREDRAYLAGLVQALFPREHQRHQELVEQILVRGARPWRDAINAARASRDAES